MQLQKNTSCRPRLPSAHMVFLDSLSRPYILEPPICTPPPPPRLQPQLRDADADGVTHHPHPASYIAYRKQKTNKEQQQIKKNNLVLGEYSFTEADLSRFGHGY